jgi:2-methylcitrate dehydratase PrpD
MTLLDDLAAFVSNVSFKALSPATIEHLEVHLFDSLGALTVGATTDEARAACVWVKGIGLDQVDVQGASARTFFSAPLPYSLFLTCVATRLTEVDDIDLTSCTTPSSVVVPSALCLARSTRASGKQVLEALAAGYDIVARLGAAVHGPRILYRGVWPTYLCGPIGSAAVCSKILGLTPEQTREALALSLTLSSGLAGKPGAGLSSRWITLGWGVQNGLFAALAAARGFCSDSTLLDGLFLSTFGLDLDQRLLLEGLGREYKVETVGIKPYCSARQALASVEAFQILLKGYRLDPADIESMDVTVPEQYSHMIDKGAFPEDRLGSITSVQYQLALAAYYEDDLFDIHRKILRNEEKIRRLMQKVTVRPSSDFAAMFPQKWAGKISLRASGKAYEQEVLTPRGDSNQPMGWNDVQEKLKRLNRSVLAPSEVEKLGDAVRRLKSARSVGDLMEAIPSIRLDG